jgi:tRNA (cmo5U34)-methyltransferase
MVGGGLEAKAFATAHPGSTFLAVDPAAPMLDLAAEEGSATTCRQ